MEKALYKCTTLLYFTYLTYSPHFNTCEYCFNQIKQFLSRHQMLAMNETKIAIAEANCCITADNSVGYFRNCVKTLL